MADGRGFQLGGWIPSEVSTHPVDNGRTASAIERARREDGLGMTNDGCGRSVEQPEKKYRPIKGVGWRCRVVVRGWWVDKRTRVEFELN